MGMAAIKLKTFLKKANSELKDKNKIKILRGNTSNKSPKT